MIPLSRAMGTLSFLLITWLAADLLAPATAQQPPAAAKKLAEIEAELQKARATLSVTQQRIAELEKALAGAKQDVMQDIISRARTGDGAALKEVLDAQKVGAKGAAGGAGFVDAGWARAVQGDAAHNPKIVSLIRDELRTKAPTRYRLKLVWLLGQNGSAEAGAFLREVLSQEKDVDVLGAALAALRRCPRSPSNLDAVKRHVADERLIKEAIGYFPPGMDVKAGKLGPVAARFAGELDKAEHATVPGEVVIEPPTLLCLGFEWHIKGDSNHNCTVEVNYRKKGAQAWQRGYPMTRCENRKHPLPVKG
jgi:hypothetical protein